MNVWVENESIAKKNSHTYMSYVHLTTMKQSYATFNEKKINETIA